MNVSMQTVTGKKLQETVQAVKDQGGRVLDVVPVSFKKTKDTLTATKFTVLSGK